MARFFLSLLLSTSVSEHAVALVTTQSRGEGRWPHESSDAVAPGTTDPQNEAVEQQGVVEEHPDDGGKGGQDESGGNMESLMNDFTKEWPPKSEPDDPPSRAAAKELALSAACNLHQTMERLRAFYKSGDWNGDGQLTEEELLPLMASVGAPESVAENPDARAAPNSIEDLLKQTIVPMIDMMRKPIKQRESRMGKWLADSLEKSGLEMISGRIPPKLIELCDMAIVSNEINHNMSSGGSDGQPTETESQYDSPQAAMLQASMKVTENDLAEAEAYRKWRSTANLTKISATMSKEEKKVSNEIAWGAVNKAIVKMLGSDFCWKDIWDRGVHGRICKSGWYQSGLLCYEYCPSGYYRVGEHCWEHCPSGYGDWGAWCQKEWWGTCCYDTWFGRICHGCLQISTHTKRTQYKPGCWLTSSTCATCPAGHYYYGASCYKDPAYAAWGKTEFQCIGGDLTCRRKCTDHFGTDCGGACSLDTASCVGGTLNLIQSVVEASVDSAMLVMSFGASSAASLASATTRKQMRDQAVAAARRNAQQVKKEAFRTHLRSTWTKKIKDETKKIIKEYLEGKMTLAEENAMIAYAEGGAEGFMEAYLERAEQQGEDTTLIGEVKEVDPTGIAEALDTSLGGDATDNEKAAAWIDVMANVDPTGVLGAVAAFVKINNCGYEISKAAEEMAKEITPPSIDELQAMKKPSTTTSPRRRRTR